MRHKPAAATPISLFPASTSSLPIEEGAAQTKVQMGASRASGAGEAGTGGGGAKIGSRSERRKQGSKKHFFLARATLMHDVPRASAGIYHII